MKLQCGEVRDRLDDYLDGELPEAQFQEVELHLAECAACAAEERSLRAVIARYAALPREKEPPRDLWPEIATRLEAPGALQRVGPRWLLPLAAAAAVVLAVGALVFSRPVTTPVAATSPRPGAAPAAAVPVSAELAGSPGLLAAEETYAQATAELLAALEARRATLPPGTLERVQANVESIDRALGEIRSALAADPTSAELAQMLRDTHQRKIEALSRVVRLSSL